MRKYSCEFGLGGKNSADIRWHPDPRKISLGVAQEIDGVAPVVGEYPVEQATIPQVATVVQVFEPDNEYPIRPPLLVTGGIHSLRLHPVAVMSPPFTGHLNCGIL